MSELFFMTTRHSLLSNVLAEMLGEALDEAFFGHGKFWTIISNLDQMEQKG